MEDPQKSQVREWHSIIHLVFVNMCTEMLKWFFCFFYSWFWNVFSRFFFSPAQDFTNRLKKQWYHTATLLKPETHWIGTSCPQHGFNPMMQQAMFMSRNQMQRAISNRKPSQIKRSDQEGRLDPGTGRPRGCFGTAIRYAVRLPRRHNKCLCPERRTKIDVVVPKRLENVQSSRRARPRSHVSTEKKRKTAREGDRG